MKSPRALIALSVLLLTVGIVAVPLIWDCVHRFYPTPETESAFLKKLHPDERTGPVQRRGRLVVPERHPVGRLRPHETAAKDADNVLSFAGPCDLGAARRFREGRRPELRSEAFQHPHVAIGEFFR